MTAIVTGQERDRGDLPKSSPTGVSSGEALETILEYAEERGLSTGVVSNSSMADATPAACYAHANDRGKFGEIFAHVVKPRFGDGVDVVIGPGRARIVKETAALGVDLDRDLSKRRCAFVDSLQALSPVAAKASCAVALWDGGALIWRRRWMGRYAYFLGILRDFS